ncbi:hypothetical protein LTR53_019214, partial [Teratosphaeriaceae sp. CCFEE 6253]
MTFYSYIFPNTALTSATFAIARALDNKPLRLVACVMTCLLVLAWMAVFSLMIHAVVKKDILWPQKQEDRAEGGWEVHPDEKRVCDPRCPSEMPVPQRAMSDGGIPPPAVAIDGELDGKMEKEMELGIERRKRRDSAGASPSSAA